MSRVQAAGITIDGTPVDGVRIIDAPRFDDARGWFAELWNAERYRAAGLDIEFAQDNVSYSTRGVLRGLHFQSPLPQAKLVSVLSGAVFDVVVDVRTGSPTYAQWYGCELSADNHRQLYIPEGCAHGFLVLSDDALVHYNCTSVHHAPSDRALAWDDPDVGIAWPDAPLTISDKDRAAPTLRALNDAGVLPAWNG